MLTLADKIKAIYPQVEDSDFQSTIILRDDGNGAYIAQWNYPNTSQPTIAQLAAITSLPLSSLIPAFESVTQSYLDDYARLWGYDSLVSTASYANSTNTQFKAEALALIAWRDQVWAFASTYLAQVQAGSATPPATPAAFVALLPVKPAAPVRTV